MKEFMKKLWLWIMDIFSDEENPEEPIYDPMHIASMIVLTLFGISILFWLFWALLVFRGGLLSKVIPFLSVVFTSKTLADYGYEGYPYEMGVFDGWITNIIAFAILCGFVFCIIRIFRRKK